MTPFSQTGNHYWRNLITRMALVIATVFIIVWFLPRSEGRLFHYDEGKPWMYGQLIAKFDFPIFKTEETLKAERDSIIKNFQPYFFRNAKVEEQQTASFRSKVASNFPEITPALAYIVGQRLHEIYQQGIMTPADYAKVAKDSTATVRIVDGKQAISTPARASTLPSLPTSTCSKTSCWHRNGLYCNAAI